MEKENINIKHLYSIFFGKKLVELTKTEPKTPLKTKTDPNILTPMSKSIYLATSPRSQPYILKEMQANTKTINKIEGNSDKSDPDYQEKFENNGLGFFMEDFLSAYGFCPVCGEKTLQKYLHSNVPVVDLVCTNKQYHLKNNKCFLFQVKISLTNEYFSLVDRKIIVGSKTFGQISHLQKGDNSMLDKLVVPGYICIKLNKKLDKIQTYVIDHRNSFVLVPNYQIFYDKSYYEYLDVPNKYRKNVITWNTNMVNTLPLDKVTKTNIIHHEFFSEKVENNPYEFLIKK